MHRVDLHNKLKSEATSTSRDGVPVTLHLACKVVDIDLNKASVTLDDGRIFDGDLLLGADGLHVSRSLIHDYRHVADSHSSLSRESGLLVKSNHTPLESHACADWCQKRHSSPIPEPTACLSKHRERLSSGQLLTVVWSHTPVVTTRS